MRQWEKTTFLFLKKIHVFCVSQWFQVVSEKYNTTFFINIFLMHAEDALFVVKALMRTPFN